MVEKLFDKTKKIQEINEIAAKLRQIGLKDELIKLAEKYKVSEQDKNAFLSGKRHFLIDGGDTQKEYATARSKLLDEMFELKDPQFADVIGEHLIKYCDKGEFADLVLQKHKTLQRCIESIMERTYKMVSDDMKKNGRYAGIAVLGDTVLNWVQEYYMLEDCEKVAVKIKEAEESFQKRMAVQNNTAVSKKTKLNKTKMDKKGKESSGISGKEGTASFVKTEPTDQEKGQIEGQVSLFDSDTGMAV